MGDEKKRIDLNWSEKDYTLSDLTENLKLSNCLVKSTDHICSELDYFEVLCFKHIYCVRAFKVSTPADRDAKEDTKNNNSNQHPLTSGEEVFIPLHYAGRGTILPLYGEGHICRTVEELVMTFPRYVLIEEDLKICSESKMVSLKAGSELELLRNSKDKHYQDKLICRYGAETLQLSHSDIGRFRVRPDPNEYSVKEILQRLKLPQIIDFKEMVPDQWEKEVNFFEGLIPEQNYMGKFLLTGLFKDKVAVAVSLGTDCRPCSHPFILPLSSDLLQQLTFKFAFRGDFWKINFKDKSKSSTDKKNTRKKEAKLKRGKSEAVENGLTEPEEDEQQEVFSGDEDLTQTPQIPFELTYTQYRFPQAAKKGPNQGDNIFKKFHSAVKTVTGKFKKASSKDVAAIRDSVLRVSSPEPIRKVSTKIYPILTNLINEDSSLYDYIESGTLGKKNGKRQSQFYFEIEPPKIASAPTEEHLEMEFPTEEEEEAEANDNVYDYLDHIPIRLAASREILETEVGEQHRVADNETKKGPATCPKSNVYYNMYEPDVYTQIADTEVSMEKTEVYEPVPDITDTDVYETESENGNETEKDIGSLVDSEENLYMNNDKMATLQIRGYSRPNVFETFSTEDLDRDSNSDNSPSITHDAVDEKTDFSNEEERSCTESGCSSLNTDLGDYELQLTCVIPQKMSPIPTKRTSLTSSAATDTTDSSSSDRNSDVSDLSSTGGASNGNRERTTSLEEMSVMELCESLQQCGLDRISKLCSEHSLDGAFLYALPNDSLQEEPFSLSPLEVMKLSMMKKGWKPKIR